MPTLRLILGDQLHRGHSWFGKVSAAVSYVFVEARSETDYVRHHVQKVVGFFAAMRAFAAELREAGHKVLYVKINDSDNKGSIAANLEHLISLHGFDHLEYQLPDEWRLDQELLQLKNRLKIPVASVDTEHFLSARNELADFFTGKKTYLMESYYRHMRKKYGWMMVNGEPEGGKWNFDAENRHPWHPDFKPKTPLLFSRDVRDIHMEITAGGILTIGRIDPKHFIWPVNREESLELLHYFLRVHLPEFGTYQDVMDTGSGFLNHSRLSFAINTKMLHPAEVVEATLSYWREHPEQVSISQVEGFIRQIVGWREYMRGVYWAHMPEYAKLNYFRHDQALPDWFWTGNTRMNCLKHTIHNSLDNAYAHHIQRLMVTGNFALLAGIHPNEVDQWYLGIYMDAIEWVEITNTRGMSQYADGGIVGTKPYVSSANYIDKMSNYCKDCFYSKSKKTGDKACPFNSLYWHFYERNRTLLENNPRIGFVYPTLDKMSAANRNELLNQAEHYISRLNEL